MTYPMNHTVTAREMMVSNLVTLQANMDALDAIDVLLKHKISGAPGVGHVGQFVGVFSERSCIGFIVAVTYEQLPSNNLMAFVDQNPPTIDEETDLLTIAQTFLDASCRRLPVLGDGGRLVGQISRRDIMRAARSQLRNKESLKSGAGLYLSAVVALEDRPAW